MDKLDNVVVTFSIKLGPQIPSLNSLKANLWEEFELSDKSKLYVLPTYKDKLGVNS